ncbi:TnsA endonuclease N-terminal domain-containing protein [Microbulbifer sp. VAAF005]|uniref:TnsA endonuclease N-terminal domain-containing protein n=1 Tax=Microbulbifer sp. VAAF005 TaxID=3034230 RepID=UPI0024AE1D08|nr:TnsA endonuclease N-terminal domain-containing protein [Microbulbifer sp. VAAF005]WHI44629.1 TnsA endonuclease N-terminal domain-containing protein [Microbulbifer sp. VAAF005]
MSAILQHRPVRLIGITNRSVSGLVPDMGRYESSLERDLMEVLRFDPLVLNFTPQPLTIDYIDGKGRSLSYTPDGLIQFQPSAGELPILYEVKYRCDFRKEWKNLLPKFRAAKTECLNRGWRFHVYTEREIRTPYLDNVKFLWAFKDRNVSDEMKRHVMTTLWDLDEADPDLLLCALCKDRNNRARMIPVIWHLVFSGVIGCDLNSPLSMRSKLWPIEK